MKKNLIRTKPQSVELTSRTKSMVQPKRCYLCGITKESYEFPPKRYGCWHCLQQRGKSK